MHGEALLVKSFCFRFYHPSLLSGLNRRVSQVPHCSGQASIVRKWTKESRQNKLYFVFSVCSCVHLLGCSLYKIIIIMQPRFPGGHHNWLYATRKGFGGVYERTPFLRLEVWERGPFSGKGVCEGSLFRKRRMKGVPFQGRVRGSGIFSGKSMWKGCQFPKFRLVFENVPIFQNLVCERVRNRSKYPPQVRFSLSNEELKSGLLLVHTAPSGYMDPP